MFCTNCGAGIQENASFCAGCGSHVNRASASPPLPAQAASSTRCPWCTAIIDADQLSCPRCGATLKLDKVVAPSRWSQLPARKDMAKLQFGNSFCQIEGLYVPVADMNLAAGDSVYFSHHVLLWKDP